MRDCRVLKRERGTRGFLKIAITVRVPRAGLLKSADGSLKRNCKLFVNRRIHFVDGVLTPVETSYSGLSIVDWDDWPDGDYVVKFEGGTVRLRKKGGHYLEK